MAGTIAARNNSIGVVGVAPAATIHPVKVLDSSGSGSDAALIAGLDWIAQTVAADVAAGGTKSIHVVNMSLGREGTLDDNPALRASVQTLVNQFGIVVVVAAGNDETLEVKQQVPATYPEVIAVASTTAAAGTNQHRLFSGVIGADTASYFTSDGKFDELTRIGVSISAPGEEQENVSKAGFIQSVGILSTKLGGGTTRMSGTSMAAPHVAGVVALIFGRNPAATVETVRDLIRGGADNPSAPLDGKTSSYSYDGQREGVVFVPTTLD